jgi:hypothetical protein
VGAPVTRLPPPADSRVLALLATITYGAAVIASWGFISLALDANPIAQRDAGPLLGPVMVLAACIITFVAILRVRPRPSPLAPALGAAASVYIGMLLVGAMGYTLVTAQLPWAVLFVGGYVTSPFIAAAALLSALDVVVVWAVTRRP